MLAPGVAKEALKAQSVREWFPVPVRYKSKIARFTVSPVAA